MGCVVVLVLLASGLLSLHTGLTQSQQFRNQVPSSRVQMLTAANFPAGAAAPTYVLAAAPFAEQVLAVVDASPGVSSASVTDRTDELVQITAYLKESPDSAASYQVIRDLRARLSEVPGANALVGGAVATDLDTNDSAGHDTKVVIPTVLAVVLVILVLLLRALVGPVLLVLTVVASYFASMGAAAWAFTYVLGFPATDSSFALLAFLFLVAFGVDYNIFLVGRARQQVRSDGTRQGTLTALALTGGVITSAGVVLAATFSVLAILPLLFLTEIGIVVAFGVLLDTLLVRSVLVPAVMLDAGSRFWWPSHLDRPGEPEGHRSR